MSRPAVFLDRDGVLNKLVDRDGAPGSPRSIDEFQLIDGVEEACRELRSSGYALVVVTNQPELARQQLSPANLADIHAELDRRIEPEVIKHCPHDDGDVCDCRKPKPGMLIDAARTLDLALHSSIMVGDRWKDIDAGKSAGTKTVLVDNGYPADRVIEADHHCASLAAAVPWIKEHCLPG